MKSLKSLMILIVGIVFMLNVFLLPFQWLAFSPDFYIDQFVKLNVHEDIGISVRALEQVTYALVDYIDDGSGDLQVKVDVQDESVTFYNEKEQHHLKDIFYLVKDARLFLLIANLVMMVALVMLYFMNQRKTKQTLSDVFAAMRVSTFATLLSLVALAILYFTDFNWAFTKFHEIFFTNDLWLLDPRTDRLIQLMPLEFFIHFVSQWLMRVSVIFITLALLGFVLPYTSKRKNENV